MTTESIGTLRRELLVLRALDRLLTGELARIARQEEEWGRQDWDSVDTAARVNAEVGAVQVLRDQVQAAQRELSDQLRLAQDEASNEESELA
ncbi:MAG: hypothetical protein HY329_02280 [Chloroflexi bacterium]|nr:hypothetical protein [Chloroflexota bacterium]